MILRLKEKTDVLIAIAWYMFSLIGGLRLLRKHYGQSDTYKDAISKGQQYFWLGIAIIIAFIIIYAFTTFLLKAFSEDSKERKILTYMVPFLLMLLAYFVVTIVDNPYEAYYHGDELLVLNSAFNLWPYFFVYLSEFYLVSIFIVPCWIAPTIVKVVLVSFLMGYIVYRVRRHYNSNLAYCIYLICLLKPFYILGVEVHRMQWYAFLYLFVMVKLCFDIKEKESKKATWIDNCIMIFLIALLSVLRREGIYLVLFGLILLLMAYGKSNKKKMIKLAVGFISAEVLISIPIMFNGMSEGRMAQDAVVVHMLGEQSLDRNKVRDELEVLGKVYDIEIIDRWNQDLGLASFDTNNFDLIDWYDNYYYIERDDLEVSEEEYRQAFYKLIIKQPIPYVKSRIRAFLAAGRQVDSYNLYLLLLLIIVELIYSIATDKKEWMIIFLGVLVHIGLTTVAMPASFFKYFFQMYLVAYTFLIVMIVDYNVEGKRQLHYDCQFKSEPQNGRRTTLRT